ncbi:hypothetical protein Pelo_16528 [Pelomyxa schiedti]|nr:hypothetical protein Pelo_16528 [Pelomyxa schiedti]
MLALHACLNTCYACCQCHKWRGLSTLLHVCIAGFQHTTGMTFHLPMSQHYELEGLVSLVATVFHHGEITKIGRILQPLISLLLATSLHWRYLTRCTFPAENSQKAILGTDTRSADKQTIFLSSSLFDIV